MLVTPILVPLVLTLIISRLALASRASRARIRLLEKEETSTERLAHIIGRLEREMEDAVVDMFDGAGEGAPAAQAPRAKERPVLRDVQRRMARALNSLPGLKKELAYIHPVRNSHAIIVSRDVKRFPGHKEGEGVLRHWADHFIM